MSVTGDKVLNVHFNQQRNRSIVQLLLTIIHKYLNIPFYLEITYMSNLNLKQILQDKDYNTDVRVAVIECGRTTFPNPLFALTERC